MKLKELNIEEFNNFLKNHPLSNFYQTINYALFLVENGYDYDLVGLVDENENISDIENVECSIHAVRLVDRSFEITRTTNGIEEVGNAFLYEDEVTNIED